MNAALAQCVLAAAVSLLAGAAPAQSFSISWWTMGGGGGTSTGGNLSVSGTLGQLGAGGPMAGGNYTLTGGFWAALAVVQTPGAPLLSIRWLGSSQAVLSWPVSVQGFLLLESADLAAGSWTANPTPVVDTATEHTVQVNATPAAHFFRLQH